MAVIGFGEAGMAFAPPGSQGFDLRDDAGKQADFARYEIARCDTAAEALRGAAMVLSLVTADQALAAATDGAPSIEPSALWLDMNSVAPQTKRSAAGAIEAGGGHYVDVAVMSPVHPAGRTAPVLLAGPNAAVGAAALRGIGFTNVRVVGDRVGQAAAIKMIRSVMVKGVEALSAECALAAVAAGVLPEVIASLQASDPDSDWASRLDYNLDRMLVHGTRRAAEMAEVVATLDQLGTGSAMSRVTSEWQARLGAMAISPPAGLEAKLSALRFDKEPAERAA